MVKSAVRIPSSQGLIEAGAPDWANRLVLRLIKQFVSAAPVQPQQMWITAFSGLPPAADNMGCIAWTTDMGLVVSNGTAWVQAGSVLAGRGCLVTGSANLTGFASGVGSPTFGSYVPWNTETFDTDAIHSTTTNTTRLVVPAGVSQVRCRFQASLASVTASDQLYAAIDKNNTGSGSVAYVGQAVSAAGISATSVRLNASSPVMNVVPGDWFEARIYDSSSTSATCTVNMPGSWFSMEIVQ